MISSNEPAVTISKKARIAIDTLHPADRNRVVRAIGLLSEPAGELVSRGHAKKLALPGKFFVMRATHEVRVIFNIADGQVEVVDIVPAERLHRIFQSTS